jgi:hypothetical protein
MQYSTFPLPTVTAVAAACAALAGAAASAAAQPCCPPGAPPCEAGAPATPYYAAPVVPVAPVAVARPVQLRQRFGVGLRTVGMSVASTETPDDEIDLGGGGVQLRYRFAPRWSVELLLEHVEGELGDGAYVRRSTPATLGVHFHLTPRSRWNWYLAAGLGVTGDEVTRTGRDGQEIREQFVEHHLHLGGGLERRFGRWGIGAELRGVALSRDDDERDGAKYVEVDGPIPRESTGGMLSLQGSYYF